MGKIEKALKKARLEDLKKEGSFDNSVIKRNKRAKEDITRVVASPDIDISSGKGLSKNEPHQGPIDFRVVVYHRPESLAAEHFKVLRANIMHPSNGQKIKSILITSALEQEGKTMVACNLSASIAQSLDPYVLIIDADVRRPYIHKMLGLTKAPGLTDYLESESSLSNYLIKGPVDKMTILQAGSTVRNPAELMTSEKMKQLIDEARARYEDRFIVIDSPPINLAAETLILAKQVDAIVLVVRYGVSDKNAVEEALSKINREKVIGMVFNGFEVTPRKYTYYKKKYYYSSY